MSGQQKDGVAVNRNIAGREKNKHGIYNKGLPNPGVDVGYGGQGGASRFFPRFEGEAPFRYVAKSSRRERQAGLPEGMTNPHPTVKSLGIMRWLVRLVTPPGGTVLDPFTGSGSTGCAAVQEGFNFIGIEMSEEYAEIARRRIAHWSLPEGQRPTPSKNIGVGVTAGCYGAETVEGAAKRGGKPRHQADESSERLEKSETLF